MIRSASDIHAQSCRCPACEPYAPSVERPLTRSGIVLRVLAGIAIGYALCLAFGL